MRLKLLKAAFVTSALLVSTAQAQEQIEWWDFLGGGDGVPMKTLLDQFNTEHEGSIHINATTLEWGVPFYTKVQTAAAVGEGPDIMTYHLSPLPLGLESGALSPITPEELAAAGLHPEDYAPANWNAA